MSTDNPTPLSLDAFVSKCVNDMKQASKRGKAGKSARKNLQQSAEELAAIKARKAALIIEAAERQWQDTALVLYTIDHVCPCCNTTTSTPCSVHIEQVHTRTGAKRSREIPDFIPPRGRELRRDQRVWETRFQVCSECFHRQGPYPEEVSRPFRDCRPKMDRTIQAYREAEKRYYAKYWRALLPKHLLLEHLT